MHVFGNRNIYGYSVGILVIEGYFPRLPGAIGNASTFDFPVYCRVVPGGTGTKVVQSNDKDILERFIEEARWLERFGVRAITTSCGFTAKYQRELADAVSIPVFASSLLLVPMIARMLHSSKKVGIITADARYITPQHYAGVGIDSDSVRLIGLEDCPEFTEVVFRDKPDMDVDAVQSEVLRAADTLVSHHPEVGAILLECSLLPPFAYAVQQATKLPVFDFTTLINMVHGALIRKPFSGFL